MNYFQSIFQVFAGSLVESSNPIGVCTVYLNTSLSLQLSVRDLCLSPFTTLMHRLCGVISWVVRVHPAAEGEEAEVKEDPQGEEKGEGGEEGEGEEAAD